MEKLSLYQQDLASKNINLAYFVKNNWIQKLGGKTIMDENDIESCCLLGLVKACRGYDTSKSKFATYATKCMNNEILMFLRQQNKHGSPISLFERLNPRGDDDCTIEVKDIIPSSGISFDEKIVSKIFLKEILQKRSWSERDKAVLNLLKDRKSQKQIGEILNISQSYVSRLRRKLEKSILKDLSK